MANSDSEHVPLNRGNMQQRESIPSLKVDRPALTVENKHLRCAYKDRQPIGLGQRLRRNLKESVSCSRKKLWIFLRLRLPILDWLMHYDFKNWLILDIIAGTTVAIFHIPQGMGFVLLAHVPAICGIYMALFPVLIYALLATSRHNAMGSFAVITLMTGKVVKELATFPSQNGTDIGGNSSATEATLLATPEITYTPIEIATLVCFMVGVWQMIFGLLNLGSLSVFLSDMLVSGFTTGAAVHVFTSQIKDLLGVPIKGFKGPFNIVYTYIDVMRNITKVNFASIGFSAVTVTVLMIHYEILKPFIAKYTRIPIPMELFVIIFGTLVSYFGNFSKSYDLSIVGEIPIGLPSPAVPPLELMSKVIVDSLTIAIVAYTISYSLAKIFANNKGYQVDATQEMYAQGVGNIFSSFFSCPPMSVSLGRTMVQDSAGGMTQMASLVCCFLTIFTLLFIGPLFEELPKACLASVIIVALKAMFAQITDMISMWKVSCIESMTWLVTCIGVILMDIEYGLVIGLVFSLLVLIGKNQSLTAVKLGTIPNTDLYLDANLYAEAKFVHGVTLIRLSGAIHYANKDSVKPTIISASGLDPIVLAKDKKNKNDDKPISERVGLQLLMNKSGIYNLGNTVTDKFLVLDLSGLSYVGCTEGKVLAELKQEYEKVDVTLCIAGASEKTLRMLETAGCLKEFPANQLFHSNHDAVTILTS